MPKPYPVFVAAISSILLGSALSAGPEQEGRFPCNIRRVYSRGQIDTRRIYEPVIFIRGDGVNGGVANVVSRENLLANHGASIVELRSSNSYSRDLMRMPLSDYINSLQSSRVQSSPMSNETFYLFGGNEGRLWDDITDAYVLPDCKYCREAGATIPGLGGYLSGVSFHFHGPGFSEVVHGAKRWFLYPPPQADTTAFTDTVPGFNPNMSVSQWVSDVYSQYTRADAPTDAPALQPLWECVIRPGEVLYFPDRWMHATLNVEDYVFFFSVFLDTQLMPDQ